MACILVDVDGTLLDGPSSEVLFIMHLGRLGCLGPSQIRQLLWFYCRWFGKYGRHVGKKNKAYLSGLSIATVDGLAEQFVADNLLPRLRPLMMDCLHKHQQAGDDMVLLTGTPDFIAAALARHLNIDHWVATRCAQADGVYSPAPPPVHPFDDEKRRLAEQICTTLGSCPDDCFAYADSWYDRTLLESVGHPVAVFPDDKLACYAREKGWTIINGNKRSKLHPVSERS